ncbi:MAG: esterase-like activity of phytase family protein [Sulfitobacter sp.]
MAFADPHAVYQGSYTWRGADWWFGGFSGIELDPGGTQMTTVNDRGLVAVATLIRDKGRVTGISDVSFRPLLNTFGFPLFENNADAEGLAVHPSGRVFVSFERHHRVLVYHDFNARARRVPDLPAEVVLQKNKSLEALALHPDGTLYTLPERPTPSAGPFPLFTYNDGEWSVARTIPQSGPFLPVGADFDAQGRFYLLERAVTPLGFRSQVRRFDLAEPGTPAQVLFTTRAGVHDNLEGLAVWRDDHGADWLTLIADDNFLSLQRTELVDYLIKE